MAYRRLHGQNLSSAPSELVACSSPEPVTGGWILYSWGGFLGGSGLLPLILMRVWNWFEVLILRRGCLGGSGCSRAGRGGVRGEQSRGRAGAKRSGRSPGRALPHQGGLQLVPRPRGICWKRGGCRGFGENNCPLSACSPPAPFAATLPSARAAGADCCSPRQARGLLRGRLL